VQVIHTNAGQFGEAGRLGIVDFCVNGGREQPSCANRTRTYLTANSVRMCSGFALVPEWTTVDTTMSAIRISDMRNKMTHFY
jgi:hypothetical protein